MTKSDQWVLITLSLLLLLHLSVCLLGYLNNKLFAATSFLNLLAALLLTAYWAVREMTVLGIEVTIFITAVYAMASGIKYKWIITIQYIFFGVHLLVLVIAMLLCLLSK